MGAKPPVQPVNGNQPREATMLVQPLPRLPTSSDTLLAIAGMMFVVVLVAMAFITLIFLPPDRLNTFVSFVPLLLVPVIPAIFTLITSRKAAEAAQEAQGAASAAAVGVQENKEAVSAVYMKVDGHMDELKKLIAETAYRAGQVDAERRNRRATDPDYIGPETALKPASTDAIADIMNGAKDLQDE